MQKKYSIWNQYNYMYKNLWNYSHQLFFYTLIEIITNGLQPLITVILPAVIVGLLERRCDITTLIVVSLVTFFIAGLLNGAATYFKEKNWWFYIFYRVEGPYGILLKKSMTIDYALYEQENIQIKRSKSEEAIGSNTNGIEGFYHYNTLLLTNLFGLLLYIIILSNLHLLIVICLLLISIVQYFFYIIAKRYEENHKAEQAIRNRNQQYLFSLAYDTNSGKDIRLYQLQNWLISIFERYNREFQKQESKNKSLYFLYDFVGLLLQFIRDGICYIYLIYSLKQGLSVGEFVLYIGIVRGFGMWFSRISDNFANVSRCLVEVNYFRDYEDLENVCLHNEGKVLQIGDNESFDIEFDHVSYSYPNSDKKVLNDLSFHIHSKQKIALVGVNGAGKTTIVKLLCGFYKPTSGKILINGLDINDLDIDKYFDQVSVLFQDGILLSLSIAENITGQSKEFIDEKKLKKVLELSGLKDKVYSLPKKEDTYIRKDLDENGIQLSGGEVQKLFLARALYKQSPMIILDEPTAALDAIAESEMYNKYAELVCDKTSIFISHRLSSTRFCDQIFFLEDGQIKEIGNHDDLMMLNGSYAKMFAVQSQYYVREDDKDESK